MNTNLGKLMTLVDGNCKVIDASTTPEDKDKVFAIVRKTVKYPFGINFENLIGSGFMPIRMHKYNSKDEIIVNYREAKILKEVE